MRLLSPEMEAEKRDIMPSDILVEDVTAMLFRAVSMCHNSSVKNILDVYPEAVFKISYLIF